MSKTMAVRVGRVRNGELNPIIGAMKNSAPEGGMDQLIREIDKAAVETRAGLGKVIAAGQAPGARLHRERSDSVNAWRGK